MTNYKLRGKNMFNFVNGNPFNQKIESAVSTGQGQQQKQQHQEDEDEKRYLEDDDQDEVTLSKLPELTEDEVEYLAQQYISKLQSENEGNEKVQKKLANYLAKFNAKKFMKQNPHMTASDFHMIMFNETMGLLN